MPLRATPLNLFAHLDAQGSWWSERGRRAGCKPWGPAADLALYIRVGERGCPMPGMMLSYCWRPCVLSLQLQAFNGIRSSCQRVCRSGTLRTFVGV